MTTRRQFLVGSIATLGAGAIARVAGAAPSPHQKDGVLPTYADGRQHRVDVYLDDRGAAIAIVVDGLTYPLPGWGSRAVDHAVSLREGSMLVRRVHSEETEIVPVAVEHQTRYYWHVRDPRTRAPLHVISWEVLKGRYALLADGHPIF